MEVGKKSVTPEKAMTFLEKQGIKISRENAAEVLELFYFLALLFYKQYGVEI